MSRTNLPNRRSCETFEFTLSSLHYVASVGFNAAGKPYELFLTAGRAGTHLAIATQEAAILTSLALQYGCPLETLRNASLRAEGGAAEGAVGHVLDLLWHRLNAKSPEVVT
jgi:hypothetical protein